MIQLKHRDGTTIDLDGITDGQARAMTVALGKLHDAPIHIDETGAINSTDLRARARRLHRQCGKLGLIIVDYLQLMSANSPAPPLGSTPAIDNTLGGAP